MKNLKYSLVLLFVCMSQITLAQTKKPVESFNKVIISPHIETTFVQGDEESVTILESSEPEDKINIEVKGGTLRVYLDDAKETTKNESITKDGMKMKVPIYKGKVLTILVTYKNINALSLRGEQRTLCKSFMDEKKFTLNIYGESQVTFNHVDFDTFNVDIYGESELIIKKGTTVKQNITAYGAGIINLVSVDNKSSKLKAYGEAVFKIQASESIKFTAYGEATLRYKGKAEVNKGLSFGDYEIKRID
ncbi:head GIN domain-containing protein [Winogradskyella thalassocola]|uniref:Putative auto-transporter adhesin, head GIN domain n=1 Tax=Winogradskyella thalassocola TaxID=262004 RepID=A0A1G8F4B9_9FLAO|nr:head GIN domain-containing protein [Winogradskyella thalassocola]SDH76974.1 Putative auto-transporter adhesin, head GIN domain [Winogradskyella thalassocola]